MCARAESSATRGTGRGLWARDSRSRRSLLGHESVPGALPILVNSMTSGASIERSGRPLVSSSSSGLDLRACSPPGPGGSGCHPGARLYMGPRAQQSALAGERVHGDPLAGRVRGRAWRGPRAFPTHGASPGNEWSASAAQVWTSPHPGGLRARWRKCDIPQHSHHYREGTPTVLNHRNNCGDHTSRGEASTLIAWRLRPEGEVMFGFYGPVMSSDVHETALVTGQAMLSRAAHYVASTVAAGTRCRLRTAPP
jgi:hypothetical protein